MTEKCGVHQGKQLRCVRYVELAAERSCVQFHTDLISPLERTEVTNMADFSEEYEADTIRPSDEFDDLGASDLDDLEEWEEDTIPFDSPSDRA